MEILPVVAIIAGLITYYYKRYKEGKRLAKIEPVNIKTGTKVIFNNSDHIVLCQNGGKYDLITADNMYCLVREVKRSSLIIKS